MIIYCAHAYGGDARRKNSASRKIRRLQLAHKENTYLSPIHATGWLYEDLTYDEGMELCIDLLSMCDELIVMSKPSKGVIREILMAQKLHIPVKYLTPEYKRLAQRHVEKPEGDN